MTLEEQERIKYEKTWAHKDYHSNSPGERLAPYFLKNVPFTQGETVIDLGCGTARAAKAFLAAGLEVYLLDHVNAVDPGLKHLPFTQANLWTMPQGIFCHWFYCTDVMEHIPPEMVDAVLDNCARVSTKGGFFQIALFEDWWYGENLHLTVKPRNWWIGKLTERWNTVSISEPEKNRIVAIVRHP